MSNRVSVTIDGVDFQVEESALLGHVLHDLKNAGFRISPKAREPRGLYCGMGVCFDCLVSIDGCFGVRACLQQVCDGMQVKTTS